MTVSVINPLFTSVCWIVGPEDPEYPVTLGELPEAVHVKMHEGTLEVRRILVEFPEHCWKAVTLFVTMGVGSTIT